MDGQQRQRKAAGGGGVGNVGELAGLAFFCHLCKIPFSDINEHGFHMLTEHASETDLADDDAQTGAPQSFVENPVFGPTHSDFTPHDAAKIQEMLNQRIGGHETVEMPDIPPPLVPQSPDFFGLFRGIQGRMNSCYLDVFFFFMAFSTAFDGIFTEKALNESIFLRIVLFEIVIPLRTMMYVKRDVVAMLRTFLADATRNREYLTNTWDFTEFLMDLVKQVDFSNVCNFIGDTITCGLIIQLEGVYGYVLSLQQLIDHTLKVNKITSPVPPKVFFLRVRPYLISDPPLCLPKSTVSLNGCSYRLSAIICVSRSHYIGFYQLENGMWIFFDCMRDKQNGHSIPFITHVPGFSDYLANGCDERFLSEKNDGGSRDLYDDRVKNGAFAYIFTRDEKQSQPLEHSAPSSREFSAVGDAAAVPAQPLSSSRESSACGSAAFSAQPSSRKPSEGGGGAAVPHQSPLSFVHAQPSFYSPFVIAASYLCDSIFLTPDGFLKAIQQILEQRRGECPKRFQVTGLNIPSSCAKSIQLCGSFPVSKGKENYYPCRATMFVFDDGSVKKYDGSVDSLSIPQNKAIFSGELLKYWCDSNRVLVGIHFERCALKPIPSE